MVDAVVVAKVEVVADAAVVLMYLVVFGATLATVAVLMD